MDRANIKYLFLTNGTDAFYRRVRSGPETYIPKSWLRSQTPASAAPLPRKGSTITPPERVRENCDPMSRVVPKVA
jgi:hypothetical protein